MKKLLLVSTILFSVLIYGQEKSEKKVNQFNELKLNLGFTIAGFPEISYERILNEESSAGISLRFASDKDINEKFSLTPYYRYFFGKKENATGFFVEGNIMYVTMNNWKEYTYSGYDNTGNYQYFKYKEEDKYSSIGIGFSVGAKWVTRKGFLFEIYGGPVRFLTNSDLNDKYSTTFTGRGGISAGYRF